MSDESISHKEDKENLLYISRKINLEQFSTEEEHNYRDSLLPIDPELITKRIGSDIQLFNRVGKDIIGPDIFNDPEVIAKTKPFELKWAFGINPKNGMINLTGDDRKEIFFASSHSPILYNYCTKEMRHLEGHQYLISSISADSTGQWLVTADEHQDGCVIVWDCKTHKPVFTMFAIYPESGILYVQMSTSARYLITIGCSDPDHYSVDMWLWTYGEEKPDGTFKVDKESGEPVKIDYNLHIEEHIMVVFQKQVYLLVWDKEEKKFYSHVPQIMHKNKIGDLTGGTYINLCHECYATSSKGCILIFGNTLYPKPFMEGELDNAKIFRNVVRVSPVSIGCCTTAKDNCIVVGDTRGFILFFDRRIRILYWLRNYSLGSITSISFNISNKLKQKVGHAVIIHVQGYINHFLAKTKDDKIFDCGFEDLTKELEIILEEDLPKSASLTQSPFFIDDFFVATSSCNIYAIDVLNDKCTPLFHVADDYVTAIETHDESPYIIIAYANGRLTMIDYDKNQPICNTVLPKTDEKTAITCVKYSPRSIHLICGRENGEIWILEPVLLAPKLSMPFTYTKNEVVKIEFCHSATQFAYYDSNKTVIIFTYNTETSEWLFGGKIRPHYDVITDIMFMPDGHQSILYTISKDRCMVEYNNKTINEEEFGIVSRERIEQIAIPMNFIYWFESNPNGKFAYFILADNEYKLKFLYLATKLPKSVVLGPAFGCFKNQHIKKMKIIPNRDFRYLAFQTEKHIGLQILPADGNPYKYVGYTAHPNEVIDFVLSPDGQYIFTCGVDDPCVLKWEIRTRAVELMNVLGGRELEPFYCLIEGGKNGWLFQEIKDLFYYMQILKHENIDIPRRVTDSISLSELPDLVRTCGLYLSEFELENMMIDVRYRHFDELAQINEEISFIDFVKLYCNHKPAYGYSQDRLKGAFDILVENAEDYCENALSRDELFEILTTGGEPVSRSAIHKYLKTLMRAESKEGNLDFLPEEISFNALCEDLLGIDMQRTEILDEIKEDAENDTDPE